MNDLEEETGHLLEKLSALMKRQEQFQHEIEALRREIHLLKKQKDEPAEESPLSEEQRLKLESMQRKADQFFIRPTIRKRKLLTGFNLRSDLENFIGEDLISKIGIIITVIGVGIGVKYSIEHQLISPEVRIMLGYIFGFILLGLTAYLRKSYTNFSAVLLSGAMAIIYFITYAAYRFYNLIPAEPAFGLMVLITGFTVYGALSYNRQVIAHIGMVGAYAVPFLLSDNSGRIVILFSYMAVINTGILAIAIKKYWKPLFYISFLITWRILVIWYFNELETKSHTTLTWVFISIYFMIFYAEFLAYKLIKKEKFNLTGIILLLANSTVFYWIGYQMLHEQITGDDFKGQFTLINAIIHALAAWMVRARKHPDTSLFYFLSGLAVTFLTILVPVQWDGSWVPVLWSLEAAFLFWIGRTRAIPAYEALSYAVMFISLAALFSHWQNIYHSDTSASENHQMLFLNINFLVSMISVASYLFINLTHRNKHFQNAEQIRTELFKAISVIIPVILFLALYLSFYLEINRFWEVLYNASGVYSEKGNENERLYYNENFLHYNTITLYLFTFLFFTALNGINILKFKSSLFGKACFGFASLTILFFLVQGLTALGRLRVNHLFPAMPGAYHWDIMDIGIRYVAFIFLAFLLYSTHAYLRISELQKGIKALSGLFLHFTVLVLLSNELFNWIDIFRIEPSYKLGLSILFGWYSLFLIVLGIWKRKTYLRIAAIVLFSVTLLKLFFYDLSHLSTLSKTVVFISLGLLLLLISFLYVKFRHLITPDGSQDIPNKQGDSIGLT